VSRDKGLGCGGCGGLVLVLGGSAEPPPGQAQGPRILIPASPCPYNIPSLPKNEPHPMGE